MTIFWIVLGVLIVLAGVRYRQRLAATRGASQRLGDDDVRRIIDEGSFPREDDDSLDMDEARRAEEEFWDESWDEPEEYRP